MSASTIHIIGAGAFGSALAHVWLQSGLAVRLWCRQAAQAEALSHHGINPAVPDCPVLTGVNGGQLDHFQATSPADIVVLAVKAQAQTAVFQNLAPSLHPNCTIVTVSKGFADEQGALLSEALMPVPGLAVLSGPSFAADLFANRPTALTLATAGDADPLLSTLSTPLLRLYHSDDPRGVQVCGALKNVIAIACGCADGMGLGASARSALMTRGLREIERVIRAYDGDPRTAAGLAGIGDLALTCQDRQSRNHRFGFELGQGARASAVLAQGTTVEGVRAAQSVVAANRTQALDLPILSAVAALVSERITPQQLLNELLARSHASDVG